MLDMIIIINDELKTWRITEISSNHPIKSLVNNTRYMVFH